MSATRSTYRKPAAEVAYQKQLRDQYLAEGVPPGVDLTLKKAVVRQVSREIAKSIILRYEWLGTMSSSSLHYGLMFGDYCAGVTCVALRGSGTAGPTTSRRFGLEQVDMATLCRGACVHWAPQGANSKLVSWTVRLLGKARAGKLLVAYSDADAGEIGTIYQACGWYYVGRTKRHKSSEFVSKDGRVINSQTVGHYARANGLRYCQYVRILKERGWRTQESSRKRIYCVILDRSDRLLRERIEAMSRPYPKRAVSIGADALTQPGERGRLATDHGAPPTPDEVT